MADHLMSRRHVYGALVAKDDDPAPVEEACEPDGAASKIALMAYRAQGARNRHEMRAIPGPLLDETKQRGEIAELG